MYDIILQADLIYYFGNFLKNVLTNKKIRNIIFINILIIYELYENDWRKLLCQRFIKI